MIKPKTTTAITSKKIKADTLNSFTNSSLASIQAQAKGAIADNISSIREAVTVLSESKFKPALGSGSVGSSQGSGIGSSPTGRVVEDMKSPKFNESRIGGGQVSADPKDAAGTGWFSFSQNDKDTMGAGSAVMGAVAIIAGVIAGAASAPVVVPIAAGVAIGSAINAAVLTVLEKKGIPVPDDITGSGFDLTVGLNGVGFDPLISPSKLETLGQFTGDETNGYVGIPLFTWQEVRNVLEAISKANGNYQKTPNPINDSDRSGVINDRDMQQIQTLMAGGFAAGPILAGAISGSQFNLAVNNALLA